jgi:hypothetical protein
MVGRYVNPVSAILLKVNMTEWVSDQLAEGVSETEWLVGINEVSTIVADASIQRSGSERGRALMLDARPVGCSASVALIASHALFEYYVEHGDWDLIDPAVINATLYAAGHSEKYLGADARELLERTFACPGLMIPGFLSYDPARKTAQQVYEFDETVGKTEPMISDFAISIRFVDLASGSITAAREVFLAAPDAAGWFGIPNKETLMTRLKVSAGQLLSDMRSTMEDF